jgi:hypothetical protein
MAHSIDLATHPYLKDFFNDTPGGSNTLYFKIINNPGINLKLVDGGGYINVYRYYKTKPCCPTITSSAVGGGTISPSGGPFTIPEQGKTFDMSANSGYQLSNVAVDGTSKGTSDPYTVQMGDLNMSLGMEGHEIEATFTSTRTLTISSYGTSHGYTSPAYGQYNYPYGQQVTIYAYPDTGYSVYGWFVNGQGQPQADHVTVTMTQDTTVQVLWVQIPCALSISSYGTSHGYTSPPYGQYYVPYGYQVTICAYPDAGWKVYGWFINGQGQPQTDCVTFTMTENTTVQVLWVQT